MSEQRYSDKRMSEDFTCYVLFSEPLQASFGELIEAAAEDYPGLDWTHDNLGNDMIDTRSVTMCVDFGHGDPKVGGLRIIGTPGRCEIDWEDAIFKARLFWPEAREAVEKHTNHLSISVSSAKGDGSIRSLMARRFDAARRMTCLAAVLAKLPITTGVFFPNGDTLMPPKTWVAGADTAMKGEVPTLAWVAMPIHAFDEPPEPLPITVSTIGMAAFNGHEIIMPRMRMPWPQAIEHINATVRMMIEGEHSFSDSDTLGISAADKSFRIRHAREGKSYAFPDGPHQPQTDQWWLFHESCDLDDTRLFGPRSNQPPPPGYDNSITCDPERLRNALYAFHAGP